MLPPVTTEDAFTTVCQDEAALRPGVEQLCRRLGADVPGLTRFAVGSRPVYATGDLVLKLFPPTDLDGCRVESGVLTTVRGKLPILTPRVQATGKHDGWGYVLMSRLPGVALDMVRDRISARDQDVLADQLGETIAVLHQLLPPEIPGWGPPAGRPSWRGGARSASASSDPSGCLSPGPPSWPVFSTRSRCHPGRRCCCIPR